MPGQSGLKPAFGSQPARDARFTVVDSWAECANFPEGDPEKTLEFFNRQMNEELNVLENAARSLVEFPEADWQLRLSLARQCSDEARHVSTYRRLLEERGGRVGQYPVMNFQYRILSQIDQLVGRLAVQNRTFEADGLDAAVFGAEAARKQGDVPLALVYEAQQADEVLHVRFANEWIKEHVAKHPISMLQMAAALSRAAEQFQKVFAGGGTGVTKYGVDEKARGEAGFSQQELRVASEQADLRREKALRAKAVASTGS
jgi:uncharacterized ferritin-like protein (DUF455 family)